MEVNVPGAPRLSIARLTHVDPLLQPRCDAVYDYTIPEPGRRAKRQLEEQDKRVSDPYPGPTTGNLSRARSAGSCLEALDAARLVSSIYSHLLDPLRGTNHGNQPTRDEIFERFARLLTGDKLLAAVETIAADPAVLRAVDENGPAIGTNAARWMQYLAHETLRTRVIHHGFTIGRGIERLHAALRTIEASATILDRYRALARGAE
jgi:hypothetical protein